MPAWRAALVDVLGETLGRKVLAADVHRNAQVRKTAGGEHREIAAGALQDPAAELHGQSRELGDGQEFGSGHQAADLVRPAQEGFHRHDLARREDIARLVVQLELVLLDRLRELLLPVEARERGQAQRVGIERDEPVFALAAAGVERGECALDELDGAVAVGARQRNAGLRRELEDLSVDVDRVAQRLHDLLDRGVGVAARTDVGEHDADDVVRDAREARQVASDLRGGSR